MIPLPMEEVARQRHAENVRLAEQRYRLHISQARRPTWRSVIWSHLNSMYVALGLRLEAQLGLHPRQD